MRPSSVSPNMWLENPLLTIEELCLAINWTKNNKAPGPDGIPAEIFKVGGQMLALKLRQLFLKVWENEDLPPDLKNANIVTIFKKGDKSVCGNYRGISLLSIAGKILARILLNRLLPIAEEVVTMWLQIISWNN